MALTALESRVVESPLWARKRRIEVQKLTSGLDLSNASILNVGANTVNLTQEMIGQEVSSIINVDAVYYENLDSVADAVELPFEDESFDAVVFLRVLHHVNDFRTALSEALRCTKKGGHILLSEPYRPAVELMKLSGIGAHPQNVISHNDIKQFVAKNGLEILKRYPMLFWYYYGYQIQKPLKSRKISHST